MQFEKEKSIATIGRAFGFLLSYFLFTTILYFLLNLLDKLPAHWSYLHVIALTAALIGLSALIKRLLK